MGYAVYRFFVEKPAETEFDCGLKATENSLENNLIKVEFSDKTGDICRIFDKRTNEYVLNGECRAVLLDETPR